MANLKGSKSRMHIITDMTDMMDWFTLSNITSPEEIDIIMYQLDLTAGGGRVDDSGSRDEEVSEFTQRM